MSDRHPRAAFPTTRITLIDAARGERTAQARDALAIVCSVYWYPIYAYVRRLGYARADAEDLTQGFFARVVEKEYLRDFERGRGRFRSFLLAALKHFLANERDWNRARKRGGGATIIPLESVLNTAEHRYSREPRHDVSAETLFERQWALALLMRVQERLRAEADETGRAAQFERLQPCLVADESGASYRTIAAALRTSEGAIKVAVHRLRRRFRELLREEISRTVEDPADIGDELRHLMEVLRG